MSIYLGSLGLLVKLKCPASLQVDAEDRYSFATTLEGKRKAQARPIGRRAWALAMSDATTAEDVAAVVQFSQGAWGPGPFVFVSADAPYTNMLSPAAAECDPGLANGYSHLSPGGPVDMGGAWAARSLMSSDPSKELFVNEDVPVVPGGPVTASAWVVGSGGRVRLSFYNAAGTNVGYRESSVQSGAGAGVRSSVTMTAPTSAIRARLVGISVSRLAAPSVTWTDKMLPYAAGQGCPKAVVHGATRGLVLTGPDRTYSNLSFTVTEVG